MATLCNRGLSELSTEDEVERCSFHLSKQENVAYNNHKSSQCPCTRVFFQGSLVLLLICWQSRAGFLNSSSDGRGCVTLSDPQPSAIFPCVLRERDRAEGESRGWLDEAVSALSFPPVGGCEAAPLLRGRLWEIGRAHV